MRFFTSDTHFGHARINELSERGFRDVNHMNEMLIRNWNSLVSPSDVVWHLGDVALGTIADSLPILSRLNGRKLLVAGNHDRVFAGNTQSKIDKFWPIYGQYFEAIYNDWLDITLSDGTSVRMSHFPYSGDHFDEDRFPEFRPRNDGKVLLHGHIHSKDKIVNGQIHVGVDAWDFRPASEDEIIDLIGSLK